MIVNKGNLIDELEPEVDNDALDKLSTCETAFPEVTTDIIVVNKVAHNYRKWLYSLMKDALGERILEIGSGVGNYTYFLLQHGAVWATDVEDSYLEFLARQFSKYKNCRIDKLKLDVWDEKTCNKVGTFHPDTIVCLNVLEHVNHDDAVVHAIMNCLEIGGHLVLIVPALPFLYCSMDKRYGHYRRYRSQDAYRLIKGYPNARVVRCQYFNIVGIVGWLNHILLKRNHLSRHQIQLFDKLVPFLSFVERIIPTPIGLSLMIWIKRVR